MTPMMRCLTCLTLVPVAATTPAAALSARLDAPVSHAVRCGTPATSTIERQYTVRGRVKLLPIWTGRRDVGQAQFTRAAHGAASAIRSRVAGGESLTQLATIQPERALTFRDLVRAIASARGHANWKAIFR